MRLSAQISRLAKTIIIFFFFVVLSTLSAGQIQAQSQVSEPHSYTNDSSDFRTPNADTTVPINSSSYTQIIFIDILSALGCQLTGVDIVDETRPCIGYNPETKQLTQVNVPDGSNPQLGGALGLMSGQIGVLYRQPISSVEYLNHMASNFGIVQNSYAGNAQPKGPELKTAVCDPNSSPMGYGFCSLYAVMDMWQFVRNLAYAFLVMAFVVLALGIMLRFNIDARTVMTLQNQIPRVIISILLITFSYTIAGAMVDLMWTVTYMGMSAITNGTQATMCDKTDGSGADRPVDNAVQKHILQTPLSFVNSLFSGNCAFAIGAKGIMNLSNDTGGAIGDMVTELVMTAVGINYNSARSSCNLITNFGDCVGSAVGFIVSALIKLAMGIVLLVTLARLWFNLLKTAALFLIYTISGPIWIVFGLLPGRPMGFEKWMRQIFAHLIPFPLVAWMLTFAFVLSFEYSNKPDPNTMFIPPLVGNPSMNNFGVLLAFGLILLTPGIPDIIKQKMKVPPGGMGAIIHGNLAGGTKVGMKAGEKGWARSVRRANEEKGINAGFLRQFGYGRVLGMKGKDPKLNPTRRYKVVRWLTGQEMNHNGNKDRR